MSIIQHIIIGLLVIATVLIGVTMIVAGNHSYTGSTSNVTMTKNFEPQKQETTTYQNSESTELSERQTPMSGFRTETTPEEHESQGSDKRAVLKDEFNSK